MEKRFGEIYDITILQGHIFTFSFFSGYVIRVLSTQNNTMVDTFAFGSTQLQRGEFVEYLAVSHSTQSLNITCSQPCMVAQYNKGQQHLIF